MYSLFACLHTYPCSYRVSLSPVNRMACVMMIAHRPICTQHAKEASRHLPPATFLIGGIEGMLARSGSRGRKKTSHAMPNAQCPMPNGPPAVARPGGPGQFSRNITRVEREHPHGGFDHRPEFAGGRERMHGEGWFEGEDDVVI